MQGQAVEPLVVSIQDTAIMLGVDEQTVKRMIDSEEIPKNKARQIGRRWKVNRRYVLFLAGEEASTAEK
ncbi:helix-turn-helix domain-containing protein [Ktedonobacteria bacterium brp13]|nr:helix-turn-helix domain-containing protein [Ktedonobacteria bacterium brp13]